MAPSLRHVPRGSSTDRLHQASRAAEGQWRLFAIAAYNAFGIGTLRRGYSPECQSVLSAKCLTEHSSISSEYPAGRNELSQSSPKRVLTAFRSRQTETNRKTSSSSETLLPKKCP